MAKKKTTTKTTAAKVKVKILAFNMAGKYLLPYNPGQVVELEAKQAQEIIDAEDGVAFVAEKKAKESIKVAGDLPGAEEVKE